MHRFTLYSALILSLIISACGANSESTPTDTNSAAQEIVDKGIDRIGGNLLENATVQFDFRDRSYRYSMGGGQYEYMRIYTDTSGTTTRDVLTNNGLSRTVDNQAVELSEEWQTRYSNSVNGVIYFAFLPYRLNDQAVVKTYRGTVSIKGNTYHEILVQFKKEGGGVDHEDNFLYWFDEVSYAMDYFAYDYITDGGGLRFRQAMNQRTVSGLMVQDYINYKPNSKDVTLDQVRETFEQGGLKELSRIELKNVQVSVTKN